MGYPRRGKRTRTDKRQPKGDQLNDRIEVAETISSLKTHSVADFIEAFSFHFDREINTSLPAFQRLALVVLPRNCSACFADVAATIRANHQNNQLLHRGRRLPA